MPDFSVSVLSFITGLMGAVFGTVATIIKFNWSQDRRISSLEQYVTGNNGVLDRLGRIEEMLITQQRTGSHHG